MAIDIETKAARTLALRSALVRMSPPPTTMLLKGEKKWTTPQVLGLVDDPAAGEEAIRKEARGLSKDLVVAVFYHGATEGALTLYTNRLQQHDATKDFTGTDATGWAVWGRGWGAEEREHDIFHRDYMQFSRRVFMQAFDRATADLIRRGFNMQVNDVLEGVLYTCWQEPNTALVHNNTADLAKSQGGVILGRGLKIFVRGDENRHAEAYTIAAEGILNGSTEGKIQVVLALYSLLRGRPDMPTKLMDNFATYGKMVFYNGIFTGMDIVSSEKRLIERLKIAELTGLSPEAQQAQEAIMNLHESNIKRATILAERINRDSASMPNLDKFDFVLNPN